MLRTCRSLVREESGATALDYCLLIPGIALAGLVSWGLVGEIVDTYFRSRT